MALSRDVGSYSENQYRHDEDDASRDPRLKSHDGNSLRKSAHLSVGYQNTTMSKDQNLTDVIETDFEVSGMKPAVDSYYGKWPQNSTCKLLTFVHSHYILPKNLDSVEYRENLKTKHSENRNCKVLQENLEVKNSFREMSISEPESQFESRDIDFEELKFKENKPKIEAVRQTLLGAKFDKVKSPNPTRPFVVRPTKLSIQAVKDTGNKQNHKVSAEHNLAKHRIVKKEENFQTDHFTFTA